MLQQQRPGQYNEVVISIKSWQATMPDIIEAIVFSDSSGERQAREVRSAFLHEYAVQGRTEQNTPLLRYLGAEGFREV